MPVEQKPDNLDLSDSTVLPKEARWGVKQLDSNRIEIHHWKDKDEAVTALADEYVQNMQPGTREGKARELYAIRDQIRTDLTYTKAYAPGSNYYQQREAELLAVAQERMRIEKEDPSFRTLYSQAMEASDKLHGRFHKAFPTTDAEEANANTLALANAIGNKVDEVVNPKSQQPEAPRQQRQVYRSGK
jgi:hypothetical protein